MFRSAVRRTRPVFAVLCKQSYATSTLPTSSALLARRRYTNQQYHIRFQTASTQKYDQLPGWKPAEEVKLEPSTRFAVVRWADGSEDKYPYVWLRDNCQCAECFEPSAQQRLLLMNDFDVNVVAKDIWLESDGHSAGVKWEDGHESTFQAEWLQYRSFSDASRKRRQQLYGEVKQLWGSEFQIPKIAFHDVLTSEAPLLEFLTHLDRSGLVLLTGAPKEPGQTAKVCNRVAFMRKTHYGVTYQVKRKADPSNVAYTSAKLGLHTDLPYYDHVPGVQMLHCVTQVLGKGGENQFTDAFQVAAQLKTEQPDAYKMLTTQSIDYWDYGTDAFGKFYKVEPKFVIELKLDGSTVNRIHYNNQVRDSFFDAPAEKVEEIYHALKTFDDGLYDKRNMVEYKMNDGDIVFYDNTRVLHGRSGFSATGERHLEGSYFDWDEGRSRIRVLKTVLNKWDK